MAANKNCEDQLCAYDIEFFGPSHTRQRRTIRAGSVWEAVEILEYKQVNRIFITSIRVAW